MYYQLQHHYRFFGKAALISTLTLDGHTGVTIDASNSGNVEINAAAGTINIGNDNDAEAINIGTNQTNPRSKIQLGQANDTTVETQINSILVDVNAGSNGITMDAAGASHLITSSGALTLTSAAATTWSTAAGNLTVDSNAGNLILDGHTGITMQSETDINIDAPVIGIGTNAQVPIGIGSSGNTTTIKGDLVVEGSTTLQQGAGGAVSATTLTASSTTTLNDKLTVNSNADISKNLNVFGNLNVTGNINQINSDQINVLDKNIVLASNNNNDSYINGAGLILKSSSDKKFTWDSSTGWTSTEKITVATDKTSQLGGNVTVKGEIDTIDASTLELGKSTATAVAIGAANIISTVKEI